jgi:hypothetical protein
MNLDNTYSLSFGFVSGLLRDESIDGLSHSFFLENNWSLYGPFNVIFSNFNAQKNRYDTLSINLELADGLGTYTTFTREASSRDD